MKKRDTLLLLPILCLLSGMLRGMGPMNSDWFYDENNSFALANKYHQNKEWNVAGSHYLMALSKNVGTSYDHNMARLNLAACLMAQREATGNWASFDVLLGIEENRLISENSIVNAYQDSQKSVLVRTDKVGIGDIVHFLTTAGELKKRTGWKIIVSVRDFLKLTLQDAVVNYDLELIGEKDEQPITDYVTHIIGLLGHLKMHPAQTEPDRVIFTAPEEAMHRVLECIEPILLSGKNLAAIFLGEDRQATLIGGKQLPRDAMQHGRHLNSEPFNKLLKKHSNLCIIDCGGKASQVTIDGEQKNQYMVLSGEKQPFDTLIALALIMNKHKAIVSFGADNGPTNVFARSLDKQAQNRMAFIIPSGKEHDMRMEGDGVRYKQMISNCWVYKCNEPKDQAKVIKQAYQCMITD